MFIHHEKPGVYPGFLCYMSSYMKKKTVYILLMLGAGILLWAACTQQQTTQQNQHAADSTAMADSAAACNTTAIKDPNNAKPMALMMRQMAQNADSMRAQLLRGETLDSLRYPFIRFYLAEPTDPTVLEPKFYENARLFQEAYKALFAHPKEQTKYYNLMIGKCANCHESYCSGPLKKIRKLYLPVE